MAATRATTMFSLAVLKAYLRVTPPLAKAVSSLTGAGLVATAVCPGHGLQEGATVQVAGAVPSAYDGTWPVTVPDADTFTYAFPGSGTSPATGTIYATLAQDILLAQCGDAASQRMEQATSRIFVARPVAEAWGGNGRPTWWLERRPVAGLVLVVEGRTLSVGTDYAVDADSGRVDLLSGVFPRGVANCRATYDGGFGPQDDPALPADVYQATLDWAKVIHDELVSGAIAATSVSVGPASMLIKPGLPPGIRAVIDSWKDVRA